MLSERVERRRELPIRELEPAARQRLRAAVARGAGPGSSTIPGAAVVAADELTTRLMRDRGYPAESFEQQAADVSVDHAGAVPGYIRAHQVLVSARDQAATDDLREAMVQYRVLFEQVLGEPPVAATERPVAATEQPADEWPADTGRRPAQEGR